MLRMMLVFSIAAIASGTLSGQAQAEARSQYLSFDVPGANLTVAQGINAEGTVVGAFVDSGGKQHGFLLSGGNFTTVDFAGAIATGLRGINDRGAMVGVHVD